MQVAVFNLLIHGHYNLPSIIERPPSKNKNNSNPFKRSGMYPSIRSAMPRGVTIVSIYVLKLKSLFCNILGKLALPLKRFSQQYRRTKKPKQFDSFLHQHFKRTAIFRMIFECNQWRK